MTHPRPEDHVPQEYVDNEPTDVELELPVAPTSHDPWNPDEIRIHTKTYSLRQLADMIDEGDVDLSPDFQRQYVWTQAQRSGLIESILLGIPLPSFYFNEDKDGRMQVVDGVQRLTTIHRFIRGKFSLGPLAYLKEVEGKRYEGPSNGDDKETGIGGVFRRRFQGTQIIAHVIDPKTPYRVKFDIFRRINTGGTPLSPQEIRHCMSLDRSREFLRRMVGMPEFATVMGKAVMKNSRMGDREIALRLIAFHVLPPMAYQEFGTLDEFLGRVTNLLDEGLPDDRLNSLEALGRTALLNAHTVFGNHAFRKWPRWDDRMNPINRTLVESWGTALSTRTAEEITRIAPQLRDRARELMSGRTVDGATFLDSITGGTGDTGKVLNRMRIAEATVAELLA
jgi:hypothetical protein